MLFKIFQASEKLLPAKQGKIPTKLFGIIKLLKMSYISLSHFLKIEGERKKINATIIRFFSRNRKPREKKFSIFRKRHWWSLFRHAQTLNEFHQPSKYSRDFCSPVHNQLYNRNTQYCFPPSVWSNESFIMWLVMYSIKH